MHLHNRFDGEAKTQAKIPHPVKPPHHETFGSLLRPHRKEQKSPPLYNVSQGTCSVLIPLHDLEQSCHETVFR
jgi:hypothetical protein